MDISFKNKVILITGGVKREGFAIYGHTAQNNRAEAEKQVSQWLKGLGF
jgi:hypothetical protein